MIITSQTTQSDRIVIKRIHSTSGQRDDWQALDEHVAFRQLGNNAQARLSPPIAKVGAREYGPISLLQLENRLIASQVLRLLQNPLVYILFVAAAVVAGMGRWGYAAMIVGLLASYAAIGAIQAGRVKRSLAELRKLPAPDGPGDAPGKRADIGRDRAGPG